MDQNVFDQMAGQRHMSHEEEFLRPVVAAAIGGYIGHKLDQTRFGIWYNNNRVVSWFYRAAFRLFLSTVIAFVLGVIWILITS